MSWKAGFQDLTGKAHSAQAKWWLNGFWNKGAEQVAESIWDITHVFIETDLGEPLRYGSKKQEGHLHPIITIIILIINIIIFIILMIPLYDCY